MFAPRSRLLRPLGAALMWAVVSGTLGLGSLAAQEATGRASLRGRVTDTAGVPLASVRIYINALERCTLSGVDGTYLLRDLPPRTLSVAFERLGYATHVLSVDLAADARPSLEVRLEIRPLESAELVVTGSPTAIDPLQSPLNLDLISSERLRQVRSPSLGNVIRDAVPGAASLTTGAQVGKPVLRGLTGTRVRILQNGIGQEFFAYGARHGPQTNLTEAQRVEVVRGPASVLYGSSAIGGAVNVITKHLPSRDGGHRALEGRVETQLYSNNEELALEAEVSGAVGAFGYRAGLERRAGGDYHAPNGPTWFETGTTGAPKYTGRIPLTNFDQWSGFALAGMTGGFGTAELLVTRWKNENNFLLPAGGPTDSSADPPVGIGLNLAQTNLSARGTLFGGAWVLRPTLSWARALRQAPPPGQLIEDDPDFVVDLLKNVLTARMETLHPTLGALTGTLNGTLGAEMQLQDTDSRGPEKLEPSSEIANVAVFVFEDWRKGPWTLAIGGRFDYRRQKAAPNDRTTDPNLLDNDYAVLTGSLGASYEAVTGVVLAANLGSGFRAPDIFELYASGVHGGVAAIQLGEPTLEPERSLNADLGMRLRTGRVTGEVTAYSNWIDNYIFLSNTGETGDGGLPVFINDQTDARLVGIEGFIEVSVLPWLNLGAGGAALDTQGDDLEDPDTGADGSLPLIPANRIEGLLRVHRSQMGAIRGAFAEVRLRRILDKDSAGLFEPFSQFDVIPFGTASTDAYTVVSLYVGGSVELGRTPLDLYFGVENLLDETYRDFLDTYKGYALSPGRNFIAKVGVSF
ncbi:MAG: TonB-dependent receptor [Gemmatimonadota bacterium]